MSDKINSLLKLYLGKSMMKKMINDLRPSPFNEDELNLNKDYRNLNDEGKCLTKSVIRQLNFGCVQSVNQAIAM